MTFDYNQSKCCKKNLLTPVATTVNIVVYGNATLQEYSIRC